MNKLICILLLSFLTLSLIAQDTTTKIDTTKAKQKSSRDRFITEITHDNWYNKPNNVKVKWYNRGINFLIMYDIALISNNVSFAPGIGLSSNNVYNNATVQKNSDGNTYFEPIPSAINNPIDTSSVSVSSTRNKLSTTYFEIPVELRLRTNPDQFGRSFKIAAGLRGGVCFDAHTKYRGTDLSGASVDEVFIKNKKLPNINRYRLNSSFRIGYGYFNLVGIYSLTTLFENDRGPGIHPFSIGISFNSF